jgi:predicted transcriptional regulator
VAYNQDNIMTKQELAEQIQVHDHWHNMSDDNRVWTQGRTHYQLIQDELKKQFAKTSDRCVFWNEHTPVANQYNEDYINKLIELGD